jgi:oxygen-dependent protoporphyrinogen oxidase
MANIIETDVTIVGGGISGLATAHYLASEGIDVRVLEKQDRTGGTIETRKRDGFLIDCGPNSALDTTPMLGALFDDLNITGSREFAREEAKNRYIVRDGRLRALPMSPPAFLRTPLFSSSAKLRLLKEPFVKPSDPASDESLAEFVERRLGREMLDYAINPFVSGVYAGRPEELSVRAAFPRLHELEQRYGSLIKGAIKGRKERQKQEQAGETSKQSARLFSFADGMQTVVDALDAARGDAVHCGAELSAVRKSGGGKGPGYEVDASIGGEDYTFRSRALVFAIPSHAYSGIEFGFDFSIRAPLSGVSYPPVSMVFFGYTGSPTDVPLDGFGFLVPEKEQRNILGTIWSSTLFSNRAPEGGAGLTTFVGGSRQPDQALLPDDELADRVLGDLADLLRVRRSPDVVYIRRWERAIPQYKVGHLDIVRSIEEFESQHPGLYVTGNFRGGISISDCVKQAGAISSTVAAWLSS